jgi:hypothetical protein
MMQADMGTQGYVSGQAGAPYEGDGAGSSENGGVQRSQLDETNNE